MSVRAGRPLALTASLLIAAVVEKLTVLHLPPDWMKGALHMFGGAPAGFGLALLFFGRRSLFSVRWRSRWSPSSLSIHLLLLGSLLSLQLWFSRVAGTDALTHGVFRLMALFWTGLIPLIVLSLALNFVSARSLWDLLRSLRSAWLYAAGVTTAVLVFRRMEDHAWSATPTGLLGLVQAGSFRQARALLHVFYPVVVSDPGKYILGTPRFVVEVSWLCSGIEGLLLVALLIALWILFFRKELIVRRALLVAPVALLLTWFANVIRLAVLIAIGDHGHPQLADVGFHAQAGWVSLNLIALGCLYLVQHHPWFRKDHTAPSQALGSSADVNFAAVYLLPFTFILAFSLVTQGLAEGFESLYFLRLVAALVAFWVFRKEYKRLNWRFGITGVLAGIGVGLVWLFLDLRFKTVTSDTVVTAAALASASRVGRWSWILIRVFAATFTVPLAEELAFRGFAARRVMRSDFEHQPYRSMNWVSLLVSSVVFGAMHGRMWAAGIAAGAVFWWLAKSKDRLGDAVAAHAVANGLIAIVGVHLHDYTMW